MPPTPRPRFLGRLAACGAAILLAGLAAAPALEGGFIRDDVLYVALNPHVTEAAPLAEILGTPFPPTAELGLHRPLTTLSLRLDFVLGHVLLGHGLDPRPYHLTNVVLAALAALLLAAIGRRMGLHPRLAAAAGLLFLMHPGRSEALLWISGRAEGLLTLLGLLAIERALAPGRIAAWAAALATLAAAASKEQGYLLPLLVILLPIPFRRRAGIAAAAAIGLLPLGLLPLSAFAGAPGPSGIQTVFAGMGLLQRVPIALGVLGESLRLAIAPLRLRNEYDEVPPEGPPVLLGVFALLLVGVLLVRRTTRFPAALAAIPLVPILHLVLPIGEPFAERFLAFPLAGAVLLLAGAFRDRPGPGTLILVFLAALAAARLRIRAEEWNSEAALAAAEVRAGPEVGGARVFHFKARVREAFDQGGAALARSRARELLPELERAVELAPRVASFRLELARQRLQLALPAGQDAMDWKLLAQADLDLREASSLRPDLAEAVALRAEIAALRGQRTESSALADEAIRIDTRVARAHLLRLRLLPEDDAQGHEARSAFLRMARGLVEARRYDPQAWNLLAAAHAARRDADSAALAGREALDRARAPAVFAALALEHASRLEALGRAAEGRRSLEEAVARLEPRISAITVRAEVARALATLHGRLGNASQAEAWLARAAEEAGSGSRGARILRENGPPRGL